jgi:hypothetical protein
MASEYGAVPNDDLPLLVVASAFHPDRGVRRSLRASIAGWVEANGPRFTPREVASLLASCRGTAVEPFVLDRRDRYFAVLLARLSLSELAAQTRFRVVSRETLGADGGLMITDNLRAFYIERFARGYRRNTPTHFDHFAPRLMPTAQWISAQKRCSARMVVTDGGIEFRVGPLRWEAEMRTEASALPDAVLKHSGVNGTRVLPLRRGFRVAAQGETLVVQTVTAESMLQLGAHMAQGSALVLTASDRGPRVRVFVRLRSPEGDATVLPCLATSASWTLPPWLTLTVGTRPRLQPGAKLAVARWFRPHDQWIDDPMLEELL